MSKLFDIQPLRSAPKFLRGFADKVNALVRAVRVLGRIQGDGPIKVTYSDSNVRISLQRPLGVLGDIDGTATRMVLVGEPASPGGVSEIRDAIVAAYVGSGSAGDPEFATQLGDVLYGFGGDDLLYLVAPRVNIQGGTVSEDDESRVHFTVAGSEYTAVFVGGTEDAPVEIRSFRGTITSISEPPHPSVSEITNAITSAYGSTEPQVGDYVLVTVSNRVPFFARALPQDSSSPSGDFGLHYRNITINGVTQRFLISQTGSFV